MAFNGACLSFLEEYTERVATSRHGAIRKLRTLTEVGKIRNDPDRTGIIQASARNFVEKVLCRPATDEFWRTCNATCKVAKFSWFKRENF